MSGNTSILGVAGNPVLHSMSPFLFHEFFRISGDDAVYTRIAASSAAEAIAIFRSLGMRGMNLTAPFKEAAAAIVDELTPDARLLGAVNCLVPMEDGRILGANTDSAGVLGALRGRDVEVGGKRCLVIGAGGAGKAAVHALVSAGGDVVVVNRTRSRADEVAALFGCEAAGLDALADLAKGAAVIVSAEGKLAGIFTHGDFSRHFPESPDIGPRKVGDFMTRNPITIPGDKLAAEVLQILEQHRIDDLVVVNANNEPIGIVDSQDLTRLKIL